MKENVKTSKAARKLAEKCTEVSGLLKSLAHPGRLLIMGHLVGGEKTVSELQKLSGISQSQLSQFLARMRLEELVSCERRGRFQYYAVADKQIIELMRAIQSIYCA